MAGSFSATCFLSYFGIFLELSFWTYIKVVQEFSYINFGSKFRSDRSWKKNILESNMVGILSSKLRQFFSVLLYCFITFFFHYFVIAVLLYFIGCWYCYIIFQLVSWWVNCMLSSCENLDSCLLVFLFFIWRLVVHSCSKRFGSIIPTSEYFYPCWAGKTVENLSIRINTLINTASQTRGDPCWSSCCRMYVFIFFTTELQKHN